MHGSNYLIVIRNGVSKLRNIIYGNNVAHMLSYSLSEINLVIVDMFIELQLSRNHDGNFPNLQRHNEACRTSMSDDDTCLGYFLYHFRVRQQFMPFTMLRLICAETCLHHHWFVDYPSPT